MVVVGADVHKRTHTFVAVDQVGRELGLARPFTATTAGHQAAVRWARERFGTELLWAVEDCRICRPGSSVTCSRPVSRWCGCRRR